MSTKLKGQNLRVFLDGDVITAALSCQLRLKMNIRDTSTKDTVGEWAQNEPTDLSWEVTTESAVWTGDGPGKNTKELMQYRGAVVDVELCPTAGDYNAEKEDMLIHGKAIVSSITVTAKNRENSTCTVILQGNGELYIPKWLCDNLGLILVGSDGKGLSVGK